MGKVTRLSINHSFWREKRKESRRGSKILLLTSQIFLLTEECIPLLSVLVFVEFLESNKKVENNREKTRSNQGRNRLYAMHLDQVSILLIISSGCKQIHVVAYTEFRLNSFENEGSSFHSISLLSILDSSSASTFLDPDKWTACTKLLSLSLVTSLHFFFSATKFVDACDRSTVIRQQSDVSVFIAHAKRLKGKQSCFQFEAVYVQQSLFGCPGTSSSSTITNSPPPLLF